MGDPSAKIWGHYHAPPNALRGAIDRCKTAVKSMALSETFLSAHQMTDETMDRFARRLARTRPTSIYGYASALDRFATFLDDRGLDIRMPGNGVVIATSEPLFDEVRQHALGYAVAIGAAANGVAELDALAALAEDVPYSPGGAKVWYGHGPAPHNKPVYADGLYGAPALAMLYQATQDQQYLDILHHATLQDVHGLRVVSPGVDQNTFQLLKIDGLIAQE